MNILVDLRGIGWDFKGGVEEYTIKLLEQLFQQDSNNSYVLFQSGLKQNTSIASLEQFLEQYSHVSFKTSRISNRLLNVLLKVLHDPKLDVLSKTPQTDIFFKPNINIAHVKRHIKQVLTFHDLSYEIYPEFFSKKMRLWHSFVEPRKQALQADKIIAVSTSTKYDLMDLYNIKEDRIEVIYSGIASQFKVIAEDLKESYYKLIKQKYKLPNRFLLYLGTIEPRKNIISVIKAFELIGDKYPDLDLVIAGKNGWLYTETLAEASNSPLRNRIHFTGFVDESDKVYLYNLASLFIYPSFYEGFGFPPLEAMACGTPAIVSNLSSLPEVVGDAALTVSPYNYNEIAEGIDALYTDPILYQYYSQKGIFKAQEYTWDKTAKRVAQLFNIFQP